MPSHRRTAADGKIEALRSLTLLQTCADAELLRLAAVGETVVVAPGTALKVEGRQVVSMQIVVDGDVVRTANGRVLGHDGPGTLVGVELLAGRPSPDSITAVTPVRTLSFGRREFRAALDTCPSFRTAVMCWLSQAAAAIAPRPDLASVHDLLRVRDHALAH